MQGLALFILMNADNNEHIEKLARAAQAGSYQNTKGATVRYFNDGTKLIFNADGSITHD